MNTDKNNKTSESLDNETGISMVVKESTNTPETVELTGPIERKQETDVVANTTTEPVEEIIEAVEEKTEDINIETEKTESINAVEEEKTEDIDMETDKHLEGIGMVVKEVESTKTKTIELLKKDETKTNTIEITKKPIKKRKETPIKNNTTGSQKNKKVSILYSRWDELKKTSNDKIDHSLDQAHKIEAIRDESDLTVLQKIIKNRAFMGSFKNTLVMLIFMVATLLYLRPDSGDRTTMLLIFLPLTFISLTIVTGLYIALKSGVDQEESYYKISIWSIMLFNTGVMLMLMLSPIFMNGLFWTTLHNGIYQSSSTEVYERFGFIRSLGLSISVVLFIFVAIYRRSNFKLDAHFERKIKYYIWYTKLLQDKENKLRTLEVVDIPSPRVTIKINKAKKNIEDKKKDMNKILIEIRNTAKAIIHLRY